MRPDAPLSKKQTRVLFEFANGGTCTHVARRLVCSPETVKSHLKIAKLKLNARNTTHAVAIAIRRGLI